MRYTEKTRTLLIWGAVSAVLVLAALVFALR